MDPWLASNLSCSQVWPWISEPLPSTSQIPTPTPWFMAYWTGTKVFLVCVRQALSQRSLTPSCQTSSHRRTSDSHLIPKADYSVTKVLPISCYLLHSAEPTSVLRPSNPVSSNALISISVGFALKMKPPNFSRKCSPIIQAFWLAPSLAWLPLTYHTFLEFLCLRSLRPTN